MVSPRKYHDRYPKKRRAGVVSTWIVWDDYGRLPNEKALRQRLCRAFWGCLRQLLAETEESINRFKSTVYGRSTIFDAMIYLLGQSRVSAVPVLIADLNQLQNCGAKAVFI